MNEITFLPKNGVKIDLAKIAKRTGRSEVEICKAFIQFQYIISQKKE